MLIGRYPVTNAQLGGYVDATGRCVSPALAGGSQIRSSPTTPRPTSRAPRRTRSAPGRRRGSARRARLPTGDEWEALARGADRGRGPWGDTSTSDRCACAESGWGWTVPVSAHPAGASPFGAEQLAGNVWEWVADTRGRRLGRRARRLLPRHRLGLRAARALPADPARRHRHHRLPHRHRREERDVTDRRAA